MDFSKLPEQKWFNGALIACIGVGFYVLLTHLHVIESAVAGFLGYFRPVIMGVVIAYIISPLTKLFYYRVFKKMKVGRRRWCLSVLLSFAVMLLLFTVLIGTLIPQLIQSYVMLADNIDYYAASLFTWLENSPVSYLLEDGSSDVIFHNAMDSISGFVKANAGDVVALAASSGKNILSTLISIILAVYLLMDVKKVLIGVRRFLHRILPRRAEMEILDFVLRCDTILVNYIVQSLLDAFIIGAINVVFMLVCRMHYAALISVVVGVTNLVPSFGPVIGAVIGAFILLLVSPPHALLFLAFCCILQFFDAYILKPRLFSSSMGVSGLSILVFTIVLGNMFGIPGVLLSIPTAAILSFLYNDYFIKGEKKPAKRRTT